jgi:hypothetical protein
MRGRDKKLLRAALRASYEALGELQAGADGERPVAPRDLARALRALLETQVALIEMFAAKEGVELDVEPLPARSDTAHPERSAREASTEAKEAPALAAEPPAAAAPEAPAKGGGLDPAVERAALSAFPLEELNRWIASGTVFQIRGALAFLNMNSMGGLKVEEMRGHIRKMGFSDELGKMTNPAVAGAILLFRRPD